MYGTDAHEGIRARLATATVTSAPFQHALIEGFAEQELFDQLDQSWPSHLLVPTRCNDKSSNLRRRHLWLHKNQSCERLSQSWRHIGQVLCSRSILSPLTEVACRLGKHPKSDVTSWVRLCEEDLPYSLPCHRDQANKIMSLVWLFAQDASKNLGTDLYFADGRATKIGATVNSALCIANTEDSYHGGEWRSDSEKTRRSVQIFLVSVTQQSGASVANWA